MSDNTKTMQVNTDGSIRVVGIYRGDEKFKGSATITSVDEKFKETKDATPNYVTLQIKSHEYNLEVRYQEEGSVDKDVAINNIIEINPSARSVKITIHAWSNDPSCKVDEQLAKLISRNFGCNVNQNGPTSSTAGSITHINSEYTFTPVLAGRSVLLVSIPTDGEQPTLQVPFTLIFKKPIDDLEIATEPETIHVREVVAASIIANNDDDRLDEIVSVKWITPKNLMRISGEELSTSFKGLLEGDCVIKAIVTYNDGVDVELTKQIKILPDYLMRPEDLEFVKTTGAFRTKGTLRGRVGIADKFNTYRYILEFQALDHGGRCLVHCPEFSPEVNDAKCRYRLGLFYWDGITNKMILDKTFTRADCIAENKFIEDNNTYNEYVVLFTDKSIPIDKYVYAFIEPQEKINGQWVKHMEFDSGQGILSSLIEFGVNLKITSKGVELVPTGPDGEYEDLVLNANGVPYEDLNIQNTAEIKSTITLPDGINTESISIYAEDPNIVDIDDYGDGSATAKSKSRGETKIIGDVTLADGLGTIHNNDLPTSEITVKPAPAGDSVDDKFTRIKYGKFLQDLTNYFGGDGGYKVNARIYISTDENCYDAIEQEGFEIPVEKIMSKFEHNSQYVQGLRLNGVLCIYKSTDPSERFLGLCSEPCIIDQDTFAHWISGDCDPIDLSEVDMQINRPRIVNKTIQNVVNMTTMEAAHAHIIEPRFFRVRELASIVVHPEVNENICINLDAYKASVPKFKIKIEGSIFNEIARVEAGVIFNINGNLLRKSQNEGTYYILNENTELVTTGKYTYEF